MLFLGQMGPVEGPEIGSTKRGIPTRSGTWLSAPCPFGVAGPTGDNGTSFPIQRMCVCVDFDDANLGVILS